MTNLEKYVSVLDDTVDGLLLTSRYSRMYGAEFDIAEGVAIVTKKGCRYFTDSRYIESAQNNIRGFQVLEMNRDNPYSKLLNEAIADFAVHTLGYEETYLTVSELMAFESKLNAKLVPYNEKIYGFRAVKEDWELARMRKAQEITDQAFSEMLTKIKPGLSEKQLMHVTNSEPGSGLILFDNVVIPFVDKYPTNTKTYAIMNTKPEEIAKSEVS